MGAVWAAVHEALDRHVAIKFLTPSQEDQAVASARFVREAKSAARVKHRFVVDVFDFGVTDDGLYYMVQELLDGRELAVCIQQEAPWRVREAIQFVMQCLSGLDAVHKAGLVHRDLKPENVFVVRDNDGRFPKLLDFGISKVADVVAPGRSVPPVPAGKRPRLKQLTKVGITLGTPCYMAPEQLRGSRDLDGRADLYSIGVLLYQWFTGHLPYMHDNLAVLAQQVASRSAPSLAELRPDLGRALSQVVQRALEPDRDKRFQDAQQMRDALAAALDAVPAAARCIQGAVSIRPAPAKTQVVLMPMSGSIREQLAALRRLARRFARNIRRPWMWAIATCFALLVLLFSLLRDARPGVASAEQQAQTLVISGEAPPPQPVAEPMIAPIPAAPTLAPETPESERRSKRKKRAKRVLQPTSEP